MKPRFSEALSQLEHAQKDSAGVSLYSRWINRPVGRYLAAAAHVAGLTPDVVTLVSALVTGCGLLVLVLAPVSAATGVLAWLLLALGFALDSADGQVARLQGTSSPAGEWLDHQVDAAKMVLVHTAVLVGFLRSTSWSTGWLGVPLTFQLVSVLTFFGLITVTLLRRVYRAPRSGPRRRPWLRAVLLLPADYGVLALVFTLWGWQAGFMTVYVALLLANVLILGAFWTRWLAELRTLEPSSGGPR